MILDNTTQFAEPTALSLPGRGQSFMDPTFHTLMVQATDATDGTLCRISYGMWPAFSCDYKHLLYSGDAVFRVITWNPQTQVFEATMTLPPTFQGSDAYWSRRDGNLLYHRSGPVISAFNVATEQDIVIADLTKRLMDGPVLSRMTMSADEDVFCFVRTDTNFNWVGFAVYRRSTDTLVTEPWNRRGTYFKNEISKCGRYMWNVGVIPNVSVPASEFWDLETGQIRVVLGGPSDYLATGHSAVLAGKIVSYDNYGNRDIIRDMRCPNTWRPVLQWPSVPTWSIASTEYSGLCSDESYYTVAVSGYWPYTLGLFHDELIQVPVCGIPPFGPGVVRRLCHLQNKFEVGDYDSVVQPSDGFDGGTYATPRYVAFHSSWGDRPRRDVFIVQVA